MGRWAQALGEGTLLSKQSHELQTSTHAGLGPLTDETGYGMGVLHGHGWSLANPQADGYTGVVAYLPEKKAAVFVAASQSQAGDITVHYAGMVFNQLAELIDPAHAPEPVDVPARRLLTRGGWPADVPNMTPVHGEVRIVDDVASAFADLVVEAAPASIALSGGGTAKDAYAALADARPSTGRASTCGSATSASSPSTTPTPTRAWPAPSCSTGSARGRSTRWPAPVTPPMPRRGAYDALVAAAPPIDVVHLGLGPDGHTASLFPGSAALAVTDRLVVTNGDDLHPHPRLTFTYPALARSRLVVFTVAGEDKRDAFTRIRVRRRPARGARHRRARRLAGRPRRRGLNPTRRAETRGGAHGGLGTDRTREHPRLHRPLQRQRRQRSHRPDGRGLRSGRDHGDRQRSLRRPRGDPCVHVVGGRPRSPGDEHASRW